MIAHFIILEPQNPSNEVFQQRITHSWVQGFRGAKIAIESVGKQLASSKTNITQFHNLERQIFEALKIGNVRSGILSN